MGSWWSNSLRQCLWLVICLEGFYIYVHMGVHACVSIHYCSGTLFPILSTCSESKLGRNWQRVGAACQALQTREVVKHKHFGVYPQDLHGVAAEGCTSPAALLLLAVCEQEGVWGHLSVCPCSPKVKQPVLDALLAAQSELWSMAAEQVCFPHPVR